MNLPTRFNEIITKNQSSHGVMLDVISSFEPILQDNKLYFFEEYTDHGIKHIENVLKSAEYIITDESFQNLNPNDILILITSIILHDIGMHIEFSTFNSLLSGEYDSVRIETLDDKTWYELWIEYLNEVKRFSTIQKRNVFGDENIHFKIPDLTNKDNLTGQDKKLIGEFIRRHHGRLAHEIAINGLKGKNQTILFANDKLNPQFRELIGIVARSHSMNVRDTFEYLEDIGNDSWRNPHGVNVVFLMIILRIADYLQIDSTRADSYLLKLKTFNSPFSELEHKTHLAVLSLTSNQLDPEKIYANCNPNDSEQFIKIKNLISDIQNEMDKSWAILGEVYGFMPEDKASLKFRRITSNLDNKKFLTKLNYVPEKINFKVNNNLSKLLVAPLYGGKPTYGVRELLQNAIDSCLERNYIENENLNWEYIPTIKIKIERINENSNLFTIVDNGKGMDEFEIINYFLNIGSSFRKSMTWKKKFVDESGKSKVSRNGKFGIGVLAAFLLGDEITVKSYSQFAKESYSFKATIESEYINLLKTVEKDSNYGVEISIVVDNQKRNDLLEGYSEISWTDWYVYNSPKIEYYIDGNLISNKNHIDLTKLYKFRTKDFEMINWGYLGSYSGYRKRHNNLICCNGIIITHDYRPNDFAYNFSHFIREKPSLLVTDNEGIFPVKLDRNNIDCEIFPFEEELFTEVAKHFVAKLLTVDIDFENINKTRLIHDPKFIFGQEGFFIDIDYFINGLKGSISTFIRLLVEDFKVTIDFKKYSNTYFFIEFNKSIRIKSQSENVAPIGGARILMPKHNFDLLFNDYTKHLNKYLKASVIIEDNDLDNIIYTVSGYNNVPTYLKTIKTIPHELISQSISIQEITYHFFNGIKSGKILHELFEKYIKDNYIIPYDVDIRRQLYPEAFKDLEKYMF